MPTATLCTSGSARFGDQILRHCERMEAHAEVVRELGCARAVLRTFADVPQSKPRCRSAVGETRLIGHPMHGSRGQGGRLQRARRRADTAADFHALVDARDAAAVASQTWSWLLTALHASSLSRSDIEAGAPAESKITSIQEHAIGLAARATAQLDALARATGRSVPDPYEPDLGMLVEVARATVRGSSLESRLAACWQSPSLPCFSKDRPVQIALPRRPARRPSVGDCALALVAVEQARTQLRGTDG